jgi:hypothetical protein
MIPAAGLLRTLGGSPASPPALASPVVDPQSPRFAALLEQARAGEIASRREVVDTANLKLLPDQLQRLAIAADRAEAQGATRALILMDGRAFHVDITMREITAEVDLNNPSILTGIDALVNVPPVGGAPKAGILPPPGEGRPWSNASLVKSLAGDDDHRKVH